MRTIPIFITTKPHSTMKHTILYIGILALATTFLTNCGNQQPANGDNPAIEQAEKEEAEAAITDVTLTDAQVKQLGITIGSLPRHTFEGLVEANGSLTVMPQSDAAVSPFVGANVKTILVKEGQAVRRGQALATMASPDILALQNSYLSAYNRMSYLSQEYKRQQKLYEQKIGSGKNFQQTRSEYMALQGELRTTAAQLRLIGIDVAALQAGKTVSAVTVTAPISGTVEEVNIRTGQYADVSTQMFRIVNMENLYADLLVFEKDVPMVKVGQTVTLSLKSSTGEEYKGKVYSVGKTFEKDPKAIHVRVSIIGEKTGLATGMYLCGKIATSNHLVTAISEEAIVEEDGINYAFTAHRKGNGWLFHPVEVQKDRTDGGFVEFTTVKTNYETAQWVLGNAYYIISEMKKGETGEDD